MNQRTIQILFALLRCAICGKKLTQEEYSLYSDDVLDDLLKISFKHDVVHLLVLGLKQNELVTKEDIDLDKHILKSMYRYEKLNCEYENLCNALEKAQIQFVPLKGSILRKYYPEAWMRTSCDIDVLVHSKDLKKTIDYLNSELNYVEKVRTRHDVCLLSPLGVPVELHFDLLEEGRANNAISVLSSVWENVQLHKNSEYFYEMNDSFFYFYHIAHMAKHFENGGCGIRPFIDLWILDNLENTDKVSRDELLFKAGLLDFANVSRKLSKGWFDNMDTDELLQQMQDFILSGGVYGSQANRVAIQQEKRGGRLGYVLSRIFVPYSQLKRYYPVLNKHCYLMPLMQVRRWFMLFRPDVARMAKSEMISNSKISKSEACEMNTFLHNIGLK